MASGQIGKLSVGAISLRTDPLTRDGVTTPAAWNSVVRVRGTVLPRATAGAIATSHEAGG